MVLEDGDAGDARVARALVLFHQPIEKVFGMLAQAGRQGEYRPELDSIETIERFEDGSLEEHHMKVMMIDIQYRLRSHVDAASHHITWETDPGFDNDVKRLVGSWQLHPIEGNSTLGVMTTEVDLGAAMPGFLEDYVTRKNLPKTMDRCRRWVDADAR